MAAVIKDVGIIDRLATRLGPDRQEEIMPGAAVAGMLLNGVGCAHRPVVFTPQFVAPNPLDLVFHEGGHAAMFNRFTRGRTRDEVDTEGGARWLSDLALAGWRQDGLDVRVTHLDTTSVARTGESVADSDEHAMAIPHGDAKAHHPAVPQAVLELMVSPDGGVPCRRQSWAGSTSATQNFQERAAALIATFQRAPTPRYVVAASTLDTEDHAPNLPALGCLMRLPNTLMLVSQVSTPALRGDRWQR